MATEMYQLEEGEVLEHRNVLKAVDQLSTSPHGGTATQYIDLLVYSLKMGSISSQSVVLKALLDTNHTSLLRAIASPKGLHVLSCMLTMHRDSFRMTPILRSTLRLLQRLDKLGVLRGADLACRAPRFCTHNFSQLLFYLTKHSDPQVRALASTFQKLRFNMPRNGPTHGKCKQARKRLI